MRQVNRSEVKEYWVTFDKDKSVKFKLRPVPINTILLGIATHQDQIDIIWDKFNYCLIDWGGIVDKNGNLLQCNEENKRFVFDWDEEILLFIGNIINKQNIKPIIDSTSTAEEAEVKKT